MQPHPGHTELPGQAAEPQPAWRPLRPHDPQTLGRYELLGRLGAGGMGVVYAARPLGGGDLVALKVIRSELTHRPELRERFRREVGAARRVAPFCTASVLDADLDGPVQYIVSEYVAGPTLDRVVRQQGPMAPSGLYALAVGMPGNPRGAVKIACPVVVSGQPSKPEDVDKLPPDVGLYMQADGSWEIVNGTGEHDYRFDNPRHRTLASGKWNGMRIGQFNRLGVTCLPGRSGRKAAVIASLNDTGKITYDGNGLEGIGDLATSWVDTSAPIPDGVPIDDTPRTTIQIDNIELWGTEG